jgi:hypothetical protein
MQKSESIAKLAEALSKAQGSFVNPPRNRNVVVALKTGGSYQFAYATLDGIMDMVRGPLASNGLAVTHSLGTDAEGPVCETCLMHSSGEWIATQIPVIVTDGADAQKWGSAITYARRYGVCSLLGIAAEEDDDGNAACGHSAQKTDKQTAKKVNGNGHGKPSKESAERAEAWRALEESDTIQHLTAEMDKITGHFTGDTQKELVDYGREILEGKLIFNARKIDDAATLDKMEACAKKRLTPQRATFTIRAIQARRDELTAAPSAV